MLTHRFEKAVRPARVVVLGAAGFVAGRLVRRLEEEGIACRPVGSREVDLTDARAAEKLASIVQAGDSVVMTSALTPEHGRHRATFWKNVRMVEPLCELAGALAHVVYISSDSVYGWREECVNEDSYCETPDLYGLSHVVRERLLRDACECVAVVRPSAIYGAGDPHNSYGPNRFLRSALAEGKITLFGEGEERRDHVYIDDVCEIILLCLLHRSCGAINAVSGTAISFAAAARSIRGAVARSVAIDTAPRRMPIRHRSFDTLALRAAFPEFRATSLEQGIRQMLAEMSNGL